MRSKYIGLVICLLALLCGCNGDNSTSNNTNPFAGTWNVVFSGSFTGDGQITIGTDGQLTANLVLQFDDGFEDVTASGQVFNSGTLFNGHISNPSAQSTGLLTGNFTGNAGSGTYEIGTFGESVGTWSASKQ